MIIYLGGASRFLTINTLLLSCMCQSRCLSYIEFIQSRPEVLRVKTLLQRR